MQRRIWINNNGGKEEKRKNMTTTSKQKKDDGKEKEHGEEKEDKKNEKISKTKIGPLYDPLDLGFDVMATFKTFSTFFSSN
jgi:hypothetical protein